MDGEGFRTLRVQPEDAVLRITLDRAHRQNSINGDMIAELHAALDLAERAPACRVVVLQGAGGVFCTGMDFADATGSHGDADAVATRGGEAFLGLLRRLTLVPRAVVAAVDGGVTGGGVGIAAASDFVYASPRSTFNLPEALWGLLPCCVLPFLIRRVGFQPAYAMTLSTLPVPVERAHAVHLVDEVTAQPDALVRRLLARLTKMDTATVAAIKDYARRMWFASDETETLAATEFARLMSSQAVRDGLTAFTTRQVLPWEER